MIEDLADRYHEYLERFAREVGEAAVGSYAKHAGKLIKKLSFEEFTPVLVEYLEITRRYDESLERGDTLNDVVLKVLREQAAVLILKPPS